MTELVPVDCEPFRMAIIGYGNVSSHNVNTGLENPLQSGLAEPLIKPLNTPAIRGLPQKVSPK